MTREPNTKMVINNLIGFINRDYQFVDAEGEF